MEKKTKETQYLLLSFTIKMKRWRLEIANYVALKSFFWNSSVDKWQIPEKSVLEH